MMIPFGVINKETYMKNVQKLLVMTAAISLLACCNKVEEADIKASDDPGQGMMQAKVVLPEDVVSKVTISPDGEAYKMDWDATGEKAKLIESKQGGAWRTAVYDTKSAVLEAGSMTFSFGPLNALEANAAPVYYYIIYPQSAMKSGNGLRLTLEVPASQTPKASTPDPAAAILVGRDSGSYSEQPASVSATFHHLNAYAKMNLKGIPSAETVTSITITAEDCNIAGDIEYNTFNAGSVSNYASTTSSTIILDGSNLTADPSGFDVWFACKPFTLAAGKTLTIVTVTDITTHTAVLTAKAEVAFEAGKVTELPAYGDTHTVTFNSMGGSAVASAGVVDGRTLSAPAEPLKAQSLAQGLYLGDIDDPENGALFAGWYTDAECTSAYDFATPVTSSFTLYAKWETREPVVDLSSSDTPYHTAITTINGLTLADETVYTLVIDRDVDFTTNAGSLNSANAVLKIIGKGTERTIHATGITSNVLSVKKGKLVLGNNLRIYATDLGDRVLVSLDSETAKVQMEDGCRLSGSTGCTADAIVVKINSSNSEFIMNGGEISNNSGSGNATRQATILNLYGVFTMNGGVISNNTVETNLNTTHVCGGVMFNGWTYAGHQFTKTGGEIKDNTATRTAGATGDETGLRGQQVLIYGGAKKKIDTNVGTAQNLDASSCYSSPWVNAAL